MEYRNVNNESYCPLAIEKGSEIGMGVSIYQIDSFTQQVFQGNPAGVCVLKGPAEEGWMQSVASEMNLSETAFLYREQEGFNLRWFTPTVEVDLCGHATLASAHVLWIEKNFAPEETIKFFTKSGTLTAKYLDSWIELNFPSKCENPAIPPEGLLQALGITEVGYIGKTSSDYLLEVSDAAIVRNMTPDFTKLSGLGSEGFIVTSQSDSEEYDFISRYFDPAEGINEDPVTGSAHCCLGPYWSKRLGKSEFTAYQASKRGGSLKVRLEGDRVLLQGQAVTVFKGELNA